ncbi:SDR family oxidoreductase [soil metagenome]
MAKELRPLNGKVVAITGGARGIGKATAEALVAQGCRVAIGDLDLGLAEESAAAMGGGTVALELDVTDRESFASFLDEAERQAGPLDVVVNNAGIMPLGQLVDESDETARRLIDINLHGVIFGTKLALERFLGRGHGNIVNIASQAGKGGIPGGATYCATKHAVVGLSEAVRAEVDGTAIEVHCVMPAVVNTELGSGLADVKGVKKSAPSDVADAIVEALQTGRFDVWVPASSKAISMALSLMPQRGRDAIARFFGADKVLAEPDEAARAAYEQRAARSEPGLEPEKVAGGGDSD